MQYEIKKGIPLPPTTRAVGIAVWPWPNMEVGDSVDITGEPVFLKMVRTRVHSYARSADKSFTTRKVDGVLRVWRTV